jgi:hypothetical protein
MLFLGQRLTDEKRHGGEKRCRDDYNKVIHGFLRLMVEPPGQLKTRNRGNAPTALLKHPLLSWRLMIEQ